MSGQPDSLDGDTRRIKLQNLVQVVVDQAGASVQAVLAQGVHDSDHERKRQLLLSIHAIRQRILRCRALVCFPVYKRHKAASKAIAWLESLNNHATALQQAPDHLFHVHQFFSTYTPVPLFDVPTALDITTRGLLELPGFIGDIAPNLSPPPTRRELLVTECNALLLHCLHTAQLPPGLELIEVKEGLVVLGCPQEYEVSLLLEPAQLTPLEVIAECLQQLLVTPGATAATNAAPHEADSLRPAVPSTSAEGAARAPPGAPAEPPTVAALLSRLCTLGFTEETLSLEPLRWRWRLVNVAVRAGAASAARQHMTLAQLHFVRAELDFRMMHVRLAAMVRHCLRALRAADAGERVGATGVPSGADVDMAEAGGSGSQGEAARSHATAGSLGVDGGMDVARTGGSVDECLNKAYSSLLEATLSVPLALLHSVLHDMAASLAFRAAAASAKALLAMPSSAWHGKLALSPAVQRLPNGFRLDYWLKTPLLRRTPLHPESQRPRTALGEAQKEEGGRGAAALEIGSLDGHLQCACDPPLCELWEEGDVEKVAGVSQPADPRLNLEVGDSEAALQAAVSHVALSQLALLMSQFTADVCATGWALKDLELSLHLSHSSSAPLQPHQSAVPQASAAPAPLPSSDSTTAVLDRLEEMARDVEQFASEVHRVPVLQMVVRGCVFLSLAFEFASGALCLHAGTPTTRGREFHMALHLEPLQDSLRTLQIEAYSWPVAEVPQGRGVALLSSISQALATFTVSQLLAARCRSRVEFAPQLQLIPQMSAPFPEAHLSDLMARCPEVRAVYPQEPTFFALPPHPPSITLWNLLFKNGFSHVSAGSKPDAHLPPRRWCHSQAFLVFGIDPSDAAPHAAAAAEAELPRAHARLCAVLVSCIADASGIVQHLMRVEAVPPRVFVEAKAVSEGREDGPEALPVRLGFHSEVSSCGWWTEGRETGREACAGALKGVAAQRGGNKRHREWCEDGAATRRIKQEAGLAAQDVSAVEGDASDASRRGPPCSERPSRWGAPEVAQERLQVCLMLEWLQERAVAEHLRMELEGREFEFEEVAMASGGPTGKHGFAVRSVPLPGGHAFTIPERHVAWPRCLGEAPEPCGKGAAVFGAKLVVTGRHTWCLHVAGAVFVGMLGWLVRSGGDPGGWRRRPGQPDTIEREYHLHRNGGSAATCCRHLQELLQTRDMLVAFSLLQRPGGVPGPVNGGGDAAANGRAGHAEDACQAICSTDGISFVYPHATIRITLVTLRSLRIAVHGRREHPAAAPNGTPSSEEEPLVQQMDILFSNDHKVSAAAVGPLSPPGGRFKLAQHVLPKLQPLRPVSLDVARAFHMQLRSSALRELLDMFAYTMVAHTLLCTEVRGDIPQMLGLAHVLRVIVTETHAPYRQLVSIAALTKGVPGVSAAPRPVGRKRFVCGCGVQLRADSTALLHFDARHHFSTKLFNEKMQAVAGEGRAPVLEMPEEVPHYAQLIRALRGLQPALVWPVADVRAATVVEAENVGTVVAWQQDMPAIVRHLASHVDAYLASKQDSTQRVVT